MMIGKSEDILRDKYSDENMPKSLSAVNNIISNETPRKSNNIMLKIASCIVVIGLIVLSFTMIALKNYNSENVTEELTGNNDNTELPNYVASIDVKRKKASVYVLRDDDYIGEIYVDKVLGYDVINDNENFYPITKVKARVIKKIYNNLEEEIELWVPGGLLTVGEVKSLEYGQYLYDKDIVNSYNDNDYLKVNYYENVTIAEAVVGKKYIATVYKADNNEYYVDKNFEYGFKEYNEEENTIKVSDNEWKEFNLEPYIN